MKPNHKALTVCGIAALLVAAGFSRCRAQIDYPTARPAAHVKSVAALKSAPKIVRRGILITGAVLSPGPYSFTGELTITEAILHAGGMRGKGEPGRVIIVREGKHIKLDMAKVAEGKIEDPLVQAGDELRVDEKRSQNGFDRFIGSAKYELKKAAPYIVAAAIAYVLARPEVLKIRRGGGKPAASQASAVPSGRMVEVDTPAMAEMARTGGLVPVLRQQPAAPARESVWGRALGNTAAPVSQAQRQNQINVLRQALAARQSGNQPVLPMRGVPFNSAPFNPNSGIEGLINQLNGMSQADVNALGAQGHFLDQFTPYWMKNSGGNPLAQFGIGDGLMGTLGTRDLNRILDPNGLNAINGKLRQAEILGNISGGMAAQNKVYNQSQRRDYLMMYEKAANEALRQLYGQSARTGIYP